VARRKITLLLDHFSALIANLDQGRRFAALETLLSRSRPSNHDGLGGDALRFKLFGHEPVEPLPVAALTRLADGMERRDNELYWLRVDPVTLWADLARVIMPHYGFADLDEQERNEIENTVRSVLFQEGFDLHADHPERWTIALKRPLQFDFTALEQAHGLDVAEVLPDDPAALQWRRLLNEIQMALHTCPVNIRRRQQGRIEINSVWFWGGGFMPPAVPGNIYRAVYSDHPVTRGLALLDDCELHDLDAARHASFFRGGGDIFVDWSRRTADPDTELKWLEQLAARLLKRVKSEGLAVCLCTSGGRAWSFDRRCMRRWWKRQAPLAHYAQPGTT